eukprot:m51a1_g2825 Conserved oligomeric Golgi complex subunit 4A (733) ;mRNA; r:199203-202344
MSTAALPEVAYLRALTDPQRISELYELACASDRSISEDIAEWRQRNSSLNAIINNFDTLGQRLQPLQEALRELKKTTDKSCELATNVSGPVRKLDLAKQRVDRTARKIEDIIDLKDCMVTVVEALESGQYEAAARSVRRYLLLDESVLDSHSRELLKMRQLEMKNIMQVKLEEETRQGNEEGVRRFCRILAQLGSEEDALDCYCRFVRRQCASTADKIHRALSTTLARSGSDEAKTTCADALTKICEAAASVVDRQVGQTADDPLWPGSAPPVLRELQAQCDVDGCRVFDIFNDRHYILSRVAEVQSRRATTDLRSDPRELPRLLEEMTVLCQTAEVFDSFIRAKEREALSLVEKRAAEEAALSTEGQQQQQQKMPREGTRLAQCSEMNRRSQEMAGNYVLLEEYYMSESTRNILRSEERNAEAIDLVYYVLQRSIMRSLLTCSPHCTCAVINNTVTVITRDMIDVIVRDLKEITANRGWGQQDQPSARSIWSLISCLDQSASDVEKLNAITFSECQKLFGRVPGALDKIRTCLETLTDTSKTCLAAVAEYVDVACKQYVLPRMRGTLDMIASARVSYELTQSEFDSLESAENPFVVLAASTESVCRQYEGALTQGAYEALVGKIVGAVAERVEQAVAQRRYNQLGALLLQRDVHKMTSQLSRLAGRGARDRLTRLSHMAEFLSVERVPEAAELWRESSGKVTWRLAPTEVRRVLALRVEFPLEQIAALRLN